MFMFMFIMFMFIMFMFILLVVGDGVGFDRRANESEVSASMVESVAVLSVPVDSPAAFFFDDFEPDPNGANIVIGCVSCASTDDLQMMATRRRAKV